MPHLLARLVLCIPLLSVGLAPMASAQQFVPDTAADDSGIVLPAIEASHSETLPPATPSVSEADSGVSAPPAPGSITKTQVYKISERANGDDARPPIDAAGGQPIAASGLCHPHGCCCGPLSYFRAEALWLDRRKTRNQTLSILDNPGIANDRIVLSTDDLRFNHEPGLRIVFGQMLGNAWAIEGVYFGLHEHEASAATPTGANQGVAVYGVMQPYWGNTGFSDTFIGNLAATLTAIDNPTLGFTNAWQHLARYKSELHNVELNLRRFVTPNISWLVGFRYVNVDEDFSFISIDQNPADPDVDDVVNFLGTQVAGPGAGGGIYNVDTNNHLFGLQVGGEMGLPIGNWLRVGAHGKAGVFMNFADQTSTLIVTQNNADAIQNRFSGRGEQTRVATLVEVGVSATIRVTRAMAVRAGYDVFFINGLALAPENLAAVPYVPGALNNLNANGNAIYHGPSVGMEFNW